MEKIIGKEIGLVNIKRQKVIGIVVGFDRSKKELLLKTELPTPIGFKIGRDKWVPYYIGPSLKEDILNN